MDLPHIAKLLSLYKRGVISVPEFANSLLVEMIEDNGPEADVPFLVAGLPKEVGQRLRELLLKIRSEGYRWRPFMFGPGGSVLHSEADDSAKLRRLCAAFEID